MVFLVVLVHQLAPLGPVGIVLDAYPIKEGRSGRSVSRRQQACHPRRSAAEVEFEPGLTGAVVLEAASFVEPEAAAISSCDTSPTYL